MKNNRLLKNQLLKKQQTSSNNHYSKSILKYPLFLITKSCKQIHQFSTKQQNLGYYYIDLPLSDKSGIKTCRFFGEERERGEESPVPVNAPFSRRA